MKVYVSGILRKFFDGQAEVDGAGRTIRQNLDSLVNEYPGAGRILYDDAGNYRHFVSVFAGGRDLSSEENWDLDLDESELLLIPAMAGESFERLSVFDDDAEQADLCGACSGDSCGGACSGDSCCADDSPCCTDDSPCCTDDSCGGETLAPKRASRKSIIPEFRSCALRLDDGEIDRYRNHLVLREIGGRGQKRLKAAKVVVAGAGAIASPVILYLAAAGVGKIKIVDPGDVAPTDLQSQIVHSARDLKRPKAASAKDSARNINRTVQIETEQVEIDADNILSLIEGYDLVIDCTDSYKSRYLINDACVLLGIPWIFGAVYRFEGQIGLFDPKEGGCYRCLCPTPPPADILPPDGEAALFSPLPGLIGSVCAAEALKLILGVGATLTDRLLIVDALSLQFRTLETKQNPACPVCGSNPAIKTMDDFDAEDFRRPVEAEPELPIGNIAPEDLARRIESGSPIMIVDVREPHERTALRFPNAIPIPIGQLERRLREFDPNRDTVFVCKTGRRSLFAAKTLREIGYAGPLFSLAGGIDAMKDIMFSHEGAWL
ncbi:MAG: ThiF family adenylyltransferase [Thermoguttaceae bacterium]|nr:ThiF family adenylyltransferase [Thermoguttaceae bacterium]